MKWIAADDLRGGDLRSIGHGIDVAAKVRDQESFDRLFALMFHEERLVAMRAADAVEKITVGRPEYLGRHRTSVIRLLRTAREKELKWHAVSLVSRIGLTRAHLGTVWEVLRSYALDPKESRIVRVNSLQSMFDIALRMPDLGPDLESVMKDLEPEQIPSIAARLRILKKTQSRRGESARSR